MIPIKYFYRSCVLTIVSIFTAPSWALPLTFEFTGTISDTVLISGSYQTLFTTHPEWNGQQVTGRLTMDLSKATASPFNDPSYTQYSKSDIDSPDADWMSFLIKNPDGTYLDISDSEPVSPAPEAEGNDAYTELSHYSYINDASTFYAQRSYNNHQTYPQKHASISLTAIADNVEWLTNGADYDSVIVKPEFANIFNYGYVYNYTDAGIGHEYSFTVESLQRIQTDVPEPSVPLLLFSSLLILVMARKKLTCIHKF